MESTALEIVDTIVKIGLGAAITAATSLLLERSRNHAEREREAAKIKQDRIIDPIVSFIDDLLLPMSAAYWAHLDQSVAAPPERDKIKEEAFEKLVRLRNQEGVIRARVASLANQELIEKFSEFSRVNDRLVDELKQGNATKAHDIFNEGVVLAAHLLTLLYRLRKHESGSKTRSA
jgi:hypothetical protein